MAKPSPFTGVRLTEQTAVSPAGQDQRLFAPSPTHSPSKRNSEPLPGSREIGKLGKREVGNEVSQLGSREVSPSFDLDHKPYRKDSFLFTGEEFEALEDVKIELRRTYDVRATKNDLARLAVHHLIEIGRASCRERV